MYAKIKVSYNRLITENDWMPAELLDNLVLPMLDIRDTAPRTGKTFTVSGFWVNDGWVGYPLFNCFGHRRRTLTKEQYNQFVATAEIVIQSHSEQPDNFGEIVDSLENTIRAYLKK